MTMREACAAALRWCLRGSPTGDRDEREPFSPLPEKVGYPDSGQFTSESSRSSHSQSVHPAEVSSPRAASPSSARYGPHHLHIAGFGELPVFAESSPEPSPTHREAVRMQAVLSGSHDPSGVEGQQGITSPTVSLAQQEAAVSPTVSRVSEASLPPVELDSVPVTSPPSADTPIPRPPSPLTVSQGEANQNPVIQQQEQLSLVARARTGFWKAVEGIDQAVATAMAADIDSAMGVGDTVAGGVSNEPARPLSVEPPRSFPPSPIQDGMYEGPEAPLPRPPSSSSVWGGSLVPDTGRLQEATDLKRQEERFAQVMRDPAAPEGEGLSPQAERVLQLIESTHSEAQGQRIRDRLHDDKDTRAQFEESILGLQDEVTRYTKTHFAPLLNEGGRAQATGEALAVQGSPTDPKQYQVKVSTSAEAFNALVHKVDEAVHILIPQPEVKEEIVEGPNARRTARALSHMTEVAVSSASSAGRALSGGMPRARSRGASSQASHDIASALTGAAVMGFATGLLLGHPGVGLEAGLGVASGAAGAVGDEVAASVSAGIFAGLTASYTTGVVDPFTAGLAGGTLGACIGMGQASAKDTVGKMPLPELYNGVIAASRLAGEGVASAAGALDPTAAICCAVTSFDRDLRRAMSRPLPRMPSGRQLAGILENVPAEAVARDLQRAATAGVRIPAQAANQVLRAASQQVGGMTDAGVRAVTALTHHASQVPGDLTRALSRRMPSPPSVPELPQINVAATVGMFVAGMSLVTDFGLTAAIGATVGGVVRGASSCLGRAASTAVQQGSDHAVNHASQRTANAIVRDGSGGGTRASSSGVAASSSGGVLSRHNPVAARAQTLATAAGVVADSHQRSLQRGSSLATGNLTRGMTAASRHTRSTSCATMPVPVRESNGGSGRELPNGRTAAIAVAAAAPMLRQVVGDAIAPGMGALMDVGPGALGYLAPTDISPEGILQSRVTDQVSSRGR